MPLTLYNTLTRQKEEFTLRPKQTQIGMYVCGPTVYDFAHIGNARPVIVFDVLYRLLKHAFPNVSVRYVRNITDVDDKINAAAKANNESIRDLTERTAKAFHEDVAALGCLPPDVEPRATEHIAEMIAMIERLIGQGHAYVAQGHVLFAVANDPDYGKLSRRNRDEMIAGARVEVAPYKRDPADFVLWKPSTPDLPGWDSPWGRGRPGWHIECSAMSEKYLGASFDIHAGGLDLIFPHHENEIAQSECAHPGAPFARFWLHNGFVMVNGAKMAKSEGNFRTIRDVLNEAPGEAARLMMLKTHYRHPLDWTSEGLREAKANLDRWYRFLETAEATLNTTDFQDQRAEAEQPLESALEALLDDLNTPGVISLVNMQVNEAFHDLASGDKAREFDFRYTVGEVKKITNLLGLLQEKPADWFRWHPPSAHSLGAAQIEQMIAARNAARKAKNFADADRIRTELALKGILLEDGPQGTTWRRA